MSEVLIGIIDPDGYEKVNRVYSTKGECPTLQDRDFKDPIKILDIEKVSNTIGRAEQSRAEQSRAEQSRAEQSRIAA